MMTFGQYSRLERSRDHGGDEVSYKDLFTNESVWYGKAEETVNGSIPSSSIFHPQHVNSYEYEKPQRGPNPSLHQYRYHRHKHRRRKDSKGEDIHSQGDDDSDEDKSSCGVWPGLFCCFGILTAIILIIVLCNYVEKKTKVEKEEKANLEVSLSK